MKNNIVELAALVIICFEKKKHDDGIKAIDQNKPWIKRFMKDVVNSNINLAKYVLNCI